MVAVRKFEVVGWCTACQRSRARLRISVESRCCLSIQYSVSVHPPRYDVALVVLTRWRGEGPTTRKNVQIDVGDPDRWDSRTGVHNLSARMGPKGTVRARGTSQIDDLMIGHTEGYIAMTVLWYCPGLTLAIIVLAALALALAVAALPGERCGPTTRAQSRSSLLELSPAIH